MPFDSTPQEIVYTGTAKKLDDALKLFGPEGENWFGHFGPKPGLKAQSFCAGMALRKVSGNTSRPWVSGNTSRPWELFQMVIGNSHIPEWNDALGRTFAEVKAAFIKARDLAAAEQ